MNVEDFQGLMRRLYLERDRGRGTMKTLAWFVEEVGELAHELRRLEEGTLEDKARLEEEFADVLAWLCSLANLTGVDLETAARTKYPGKCPKCGQIPCRCTSH